MRKEQPVKILLTVTNVFAPVPLIHTETPEKYLVQTWMSVKIGTNVLDGSACVSIFPEAIDVHVDQGTWIILMTVITTVAGMKMNA